MATKTLRTPASHTHAIAARQRPRRSFLAWPAWQRVLAVLPVLALLWLGVLWAQMGSTPW